MSQTTQAGPTKDLEYLSGWFNVEIDGQLKGAFTDAGGLNVEVNVVEITDANQDTNTRKTPGVAKYGEITLKRKLSKDKYFWTWAKDIKDGKNEFRRNGSIVIFDIAKKEVGRWNFTNAWPSKWSASDLDVGSDDPMVEDITLAIEYLERVK